MKILLTGGGTGGHFYPVIAVAQQINEIAKENRLVRPEIYFMSTDPYNEGLLFENNIQFEQVISGKIRRKKSLANQFLNFFDLWKIFFGSIEAIWRMFVIYPDVVFSKGGYASFPALLAARILRIPVVIHESDSEPGKVSRWSSKFAQKIAISYPEAITFFPKDKTAYTGNPLRKDIEEALPSGGHAFFNFDQNIPTILVLGGSQGARFINTIIMDLLPELIEKYQIIHQTGKNNYKIILETRDVVLAKNPHIDRYKPYDYLNTINLRAAAGAADLIISRAGSTIFEIASWAKPSIIIPIPEETSHDQRLNAYSYARTGAAEVIEEKNFSQGVLLSEIERIISDKNLREKMSTAAKNFARRDAARLIGQEIMSIAIEHEK